MQIGYLFKQVGIYKINYCIFRKPITKYIDVIYFQLVLMLTENAVVEK